MLCDHRAFMSPESCSRFSSTAGKPRHIPLRQTRPYQPTRSCFLFHLSLRVDPFLRWPALESCSSTYRFQLGKTWSSNLHSSTSSIYLLQHVVKTGNFVCTWSSCLCALLIIFFISGCWLFFCTYLVHDIYSGVYYYCCRRAMETFCDEGGSVRHEKSSSVCRRYSRTQN